MSTLGRSIFDKVATKEDDYTQLLCNLMQRRNEGEGFRIAVLSKLLGDPILAAQIAPDQISTQVVVRGSGRPDLVIDAPTVCAAVEVKLNRHRPCNKNQLPADDETLRGYIGFLRTAPSARKILSFLVPGDWKYLQDTCDRLIELRQCEGSIEIRPPVLWEEILSLSKQFCTDPLHLEFWSLLRKDFEPMKFSVEEANMAVNGIGLPSRVFNKAAYVVDQVYRKAEKCDGKFFPGEPEHDKLGGEYGIWFYRSNEGKVCWNKYFFWFGILSPYWEKHEKALCFGITNDMLGEKNARLKEAFLQSYSGEEFCDGTPQSASDVYTLGWVSEADLIEDHPSGKDPATRIWERLRPILDKIYEVGE